MADFKIRNLDAQVVQNADHISNQGSIIQQFQVTPQARAQLQNILADITALTRSGAVDHETGHELRNSVSIAAQEADTPAPRQHRIITALGRAKDIAAGLAATAGIATAVDSVVKALGSGV